MSAVGQVMSVAARSPWMDAGVTRRMCSLTGCCGSRPARVGGLPPDTILASPMTSKSLAHTARVEPPGPDCETRCPSWRGAEATAPNGIEHIGAFAEVPPLCVCE